MHNQLSTGRGWRVDRTSPSLPESHRTIAIAPGAGFWRKLLAFSGPGYLVAVGYMDPGSWATDLAGGSGFGYTLLSIILLSRSFSQDRSFRPSWAVLFRILRS